MSPPISFRVKSIEGLPTKASVSALKLGHHGTSGPKMMRKVPYASMCSSSTGSDTPMTLTSSTTVGSLAPHLNSMSSPTSPSLSVNTFTLASTGGSKPSVNLENLSLVLAFLALLTRLLSTGSSALMTLVAMALSRCGHICRAALFSHGTRSTSGYLIHLGRLPMSFLRMGPRSRLSSCVSSASCRTTSAMLSFRRSAPLEHAHHPAAAPAARNPHEWRRKRAVGIPTRLAQRHNHSSVE
mmetsp:Transcript_11311/g.27564  ORF Transcript_11311/g.27564 Transcript_11311/m.27564 type:complete len:240 (+) Transcript_11311:299-1018(+)